MHLPRSAKQLPAAIEIFDIGNGFYSLRMHSTKFQKAAVALAESIPDLTTLQVITPNDTKIFTFDQASEDVPPRPAIVRPVIEEVPDPFEATMNMADAHADEHEIPSARVSVRKPNGKSLPRDTKGTGRKSKAERTTTCQRCAGKGQIQTMMEGGEAALTQCPVCQGEGQITRFGAQR